MATLDQVAVDAADFFGAKLDAVAVSDGSADIEPILDGADFFGTTLDALPGDVR